MPESAAPPGPPPESLATAEVVAFVLADLAIILIAARLVGGLFVRFNQPRIVGEIIAGILIGPTVLGGTLATGAVTDAGRAAVDGSGLVNEIYPLQSFAFLSLIGLLGMVIFMFLLGLEVEQRFLRGRERQIVTVALAAVIAPVALGFGVAALLDTPTWRVATTPEGDEVSFLTNALFLGAAIAVTASAVLARILQEKRMLATEMGAVGVGAAMVVTPLMFIVLAGAAASAAQEGVPATVASKLGLGLVLTAFLFAAVRPLLARLIDRWFDPDEALSGELMGVLLLGTLLTALAADRIGINAVTGGFLFGAAVPQVPGLAQAVIERLNTIVVLFLIPVFIAVSGLKTDLRAFEPEHIAGIAVFLAAMLAGKWLAGALAGRAVGLAWNEANAIGVLLNCRGIMILVVALVGQQVGVVTEPMQVAFVVGAIATTLMTGPLVTRLLPAQRVEEERDKSVAQSIAGLPTMTGGPRVVIDPASPEHVASALIAAERFLDDSDGPPPQFLIAHLPGLPAGGDVVGAGSGDQEYETDTTLQWLEPVADLLRIRGFDAQTATFQSPSPIEDLERIATDWAATHAIAIDEAAADALGEAGLVIVDAGASVASPG